MSAWPLYRENIIQGPSHVSLSLPGKPSLISKSVGGDFPALLLVPNVDFLKSFIEGNIGIGDQTIRGLVHTAMSQPEMKKDPEMLRSYADALELDFPDLNKYKNPLGQVNVPYEDIKVPDIFKTNGIKGIEKSVLTSIFETQKPYIDVAKVVLNGMVKIEDIVARIMPVLSANPLTSKSKRPIAKDGNSNGTKALGFKNGEEFKKALAELDKLSKAGSDVSLDREGNHTVKPKKKSKAIREQGNQSDTALMEQNKVWQVISVVYSTGDYDPSVEYIYEYVYLPSDENLDNLQPTPSEEAEEENPYNKYKPKRIILGIFKADGTPLNPNEKLKTISASGFSATKVETPYNYADWVYKSPKWKFRNNDYIWPSFGGANGTPIYLWKNKLGITNESKDSPGDNWEIKRYRKGDKNRINKDIDAIENDPIIVGFDTADSTEYTNYFSDFVKSKTKVVKDLTSEEKDSILTDIMGRLDVQSHMQNVFLYGSGPNSYYNPDIPMLMKKSFKPYQIFVQEAASDPALAGDGLIWIDPEADYDLKVIRVDPTTVVDYTDTKGVNVASSEIISYVKNKIKFVLKDGSKFNIEVSKNGSDFERASSVTEYTLDNWNYSNGDVNMLNVYNFRITDLEGKELYDETFTKFGLPDFGVSRTMTVDPDSLLDSATETDEPIPLYNIKVNNPNSKGGLVINPDAISNDFLATEKLFSEGFYGTGTKERPQQVERLRRFARTDLDNETYYIIEGVLVDENRKPGGATNADASGDDGKEWYRLPHAIGAIIPFIGLMVDAATKIFPNINKLLKLLKNPTGFITDIVKEKLGDGFPIFGEEAMEKFEKALELVKKKRDIQLDTNVSEYANQLKKHFSKSPLKNFVYIEEFSPIDAGKFDFNLDGSGIVNFSIFGNSISFGMELKMKNLIPDIPNIEMPKLPTADIPKIPDPNFNLNANTSALTGAASNAAGGLANAAGGLANGTGEVGNAASTLSGAAGGLANAAGGLANAAGGLSGGIKPPSVEVPNIGVSNITLPEIKSPFIVVEPKFKKSKIKDCAEVNQTPETGKSNNDYLNDLNSQKSDNEPTKATTKPNTFTTETIWYSTGVFINGVDYTYYYITLDDQELLNEVDELIKPGSSSSLLSPVSKANDLTNPTEPAPENLQKAKDLLENALQKNPDNEILKDKLKDINELLAESLMKSQPILKLVLGLVSSPLKITLCIVQWIFDFFKSLINPMILPQKIIEFISFDWIMKFFSTEGLLSAFGINLDLSIIEKWKSVATIPNPNVDIKCLSKLKDLSGKLNGAVGSVSGAAGNLTGNLSSAAGNLAGAASGLAGSVTGAASGLAGSVTGAASGLAGSVTGAASGLAGNLGTNNINLSIPGMTDLFKNLKPHCGMFALPDDFPLANFAKFLNLPFMPSLPEYSLADFNTPIPPSVSFGNIFSDSILCLIEKFINGFIDFVWSIMGIECILDPPHIKLCKKKTPNETNKLNNGDTKKDDPNAKDAIGNETSTDFFVYEVTFEDGRKVTIKDYEALMQFMEENKDVSFDLQF